MNGSKRVIESDVESYLRRKVESLGGRCIKFLPDFERGFPDRMILLPKGKVLFVETKRPSGGKLSGAQIVEHTLLRRMGHRVEVIWSKEEVDKFIQGLSC